MYEYNHHACILIGMWEEVAARFVRCGSGAGVEPCVHKEVESEGISQKQHHIS